MDFKFKLTWASFGQIVHVGQIPTSKACIWRQDERHFWIRFDTSEETKPFEFETRNGKKKKKTVNLRQHFLVWNKSWKNFQNGQISNQGYFWWWQIAKYLILWVFYFYSF